ncbi:hypothetical protein M409DRAFT_26106 [Zasmidium cellare ATCC 36951]|uniref:IBR domain-containing protein n=1 Tax=Zasmidium cellare ATCC 36951 TaxID=1080233 RepID=A0A6A6C8Y6_ZASCE|nr:uncharacterized protein M409DRAFT_26106 [Zasmidium cellare ATCC 36951]KAF2163495.1 hypothetical protein M409DRAFT_26106 [Zasmidium cellare ATCC 36951]
MPPRSSPSSSKPRTCTVCGDHLTTSQVSVIEDSLVCTACVQELFELSLANENNFPPHWGKAVLNPKNFKQILDPAFFKKYACLENFDLGEDTEGETEGGPLEIDHVCSKEQGKLDPFEGLRSGKDYQICPNEGCRRPAELAAGCNHIACPCGTNYCFICAKPAEELSDHWKLGGCPRYGQPGSSSALYNDDIRLANDDDESDVENEDLWRWQMQTLLEQQGLQEPEPEQAGNRSRDDRDSEPHRTSARRTNSRLREPGGHRRIDHRAPMSDHDLGNHTEVTGDQSVDYDK